eukprot:scaffold546_cov352-Prasinococcus_capsulatus_cf.AAC.8
MHTHLGELGEPRDADGIDQVLARVGAGRVERKLGSSPPNRPHVQLARAQKARTWRLRGVPCEDNRLAEARKQKRHGAGGVGERVCAVNDDEAVVVLHAWRSTHHASNQGHSSHHCKGKPPTAAVGGEPTLRLASRARAMSSHSLGPTRQESRLKRICASPAREALDRSSSVRACPRGRSCTLIIFLAAVPRDHSSNDDADDGDRGGGDDAV